MIVVTDTLSASLRLRAVCDSHSIVKKNLD